MLCARPIKLANTSSSPKRGFRYRPISLAQAKGVWRAGADLTVRLIKPQFGLGFTGAIIDLNVDYEMHSSQHTNSDVMLNET
jgi:hypothetical protein